MNNRKTLPTTIMLGLSPRGAGEADIPEATYADEADIPELFRPHYRKKGDIWDINIHGMRTQGDVDRVQESLRNEKDVHKENKRLLAAFTTLGTIEDLTTMYDEVPELRIAAASSGDVKDQVDKLVEARLDRATGALQRSIDNLTTDNETLTAENTGYKTDARNTRISKLVTKHATELGVKSEAMSDAVLLGAALLEETEDGRIVTKDNVGVTPGQEVDLWLPDQLLNKPHWLKTNSGGGGEGSTKGGISGVNPFTPKAWSLLDQGALIKTDMAKADRYAKAAGFQDANSAGLEPLAS